MKNYRIFIGEAAAIAVIFFLHTNSNAQTIAGENAFPKYRISVSSPAYRSEIKGKTVILFYAPGMKKVVASCWHQPDATHKNVLGYRALLKTDIRLSKGSYSKIDFNGNEFPHGPITILLKAWDENTNHFNHSDSCYLQLYNKTGISWQEGVENTPQPEQTAGMHLVFSDDFTTMPTISRGGMGATYNSVKADGTEYGDAILASAGGPYDPFYQSETYMRIRAEYRPNIVDSLGWHRKYTSGMLTSERTDGTGIAPLFGYFECRMICPNATGTWPAFWLLTQNSHVNGNSTGDEYDIIEGYGPHARLYWATAHAWGYGKSLPGHLISVDSIGAAADIAQTFHIYGCKVSPTTTSYYFDNRLVYSHSTFEIAKKEGMHFMINNDLGGGWPVDLSRYNGAVDMYIDWVRVYQ